MKLKKEKQENGELQLQSVQESSNLESKPTKGHRRRRTVGDTGELNQIKKENDRIKQNFIKAMKTKDDSHTSSNNRTSMSKKERNKKYKQRKKGRRTKTYGGEDQTNSALKNSSQDALESLQFSPKDNFSILEMSTEDIIERLTCTLPKNQTWQTPYSVKATFGNIEVFLELCYLSNLDVNGVKFKKIKGNEDIFRRTCNWILANLEIE